MNTIKKWLAPVLGLAASLLYILYRNKAHESDDLQNAIVQQQSVQETAEAKKADAKATEGFTHDLEEYNQLKLSRPDLFANSSSGHEPTTTDG